MDLIERKRHTNSNDPWLDVLSAQVQYRAGNPKKAFQTWEKVITDHPKEEHIVIQVAEAMGQEQLWDRALHVYIDARKHFGKPELYCLNLAHVYEMNNMYDKAVEELIVFLKKYPSQINVVENRLMQYPSNEKTVYKIAYALKRGIEKETKKIHRLFKWDKKRLHIE